MPTISSDLTVGIDAPTKVPRGCSGVFLSGGALTGPRGRFSIGFPSIVLAVIGSRKREIFRDVASVPRVPTLQWSALQLKESAEQTKLGARSWQGFASQRKQAPVGACLNGPFIGKLHCVLRGLFWIKNHR